MGPGGRLAALGPWSLLPPVPRGRRRSPPATAAAHGTRARAQVASFQCLQPFVGTLLAFAVLGEEPSAWDLGAVGVLLGLVLVVSDKHDLQARPHGCRVRTNSQHCWGCCWASATGATYRHAAPCRARARCPRALAGAWRPAWIWKQDLQAHAAQPRPGWPRRALASAVARAGREQSSPHIGRLQQGTRAGAATGADWLGAEQAANASPGSASSALSVPASAEVTGLSNGASGARRRARQRWWAACGAS